ncbi:MAG: PTS-dependent dihydroxyacetone kinase phosphotransferase subunit DhaM [Kutzneria sp.]|nr:PTS-dependent dihydroxyacetone kinase phosphotransferase subunit DhaM [Kutzneria sp.]MBV9843842.1 PTS-dependent dihydroxyacetone kinase phosphotransferase subunit DhaM [Kutzneria sp.]
MTIGLVIVSHSARLAEGVAELAAQMAPDVSVLPAGGTADGTLGTDYVRVRTALARAGDGGVVLLYDLGSARMVAELAVEDHEGSSDCRLVDAPLVEGSVAAAVAAQGGAGLDEVAMAARSASGGPAVGTDPPAESVDLLLHNEIGLHARPAALVARALAGLDAEVTVGLGGRRADARSVFALMGLGARDGDTVRVGATGPDAGEALRRIAELVERGFPE